MPAPLGRDAVPQVNLIGVPAPPTGYRFERMLALSYSFDPRVAVALLAAGYRRNADYDPQDPWDWSSFNALERAAFVKSVLGQSLFIVQHGRTSPEWAISDQMASFLRDRLFHVAVPGGPATGTRPFVNFHPKLLLVSFRRGTDVWLRLYIGSRNLSLAAARECGVVVDIPPTLSSRRYVQPARPILAPLSEYLKVLQKQTLLTAKTRRHTKALSDWSSLLFSLRNRKALFPANVRNVTLHTQSPKSNSLQGILEQDIERCQEALIVSPWVDDTAATWLSRKATRAQRITVWTLDSERTHLGALAKRGARYVDEGSEDPYALDGDREGSEIGFEQRLHAKTYAFDRAGEGALWLGSANFTRPGLGLSGHPAANFELLARLGVKGSASALFGNLRTSRLTEDIVNEASSLKNEDAPLNPLQWIVAEWAPYPHILQLRLCRPDKGAQLAASLIPNFHVFARRPAGGSVRVRTVSWKALWARATSVRLPQGFKPESEIILRARSKEGALLSVIHVPIPDTIAFGKVKSELAKEVPLEEALDRLLQLQQGLQSTRGTPNRGTGSALAVDSLLNGLRLESLFIRMAEDESGELIRDAHEALERVAVSRDPRARQLAPSLRHVLQQAHHHRARTR